jgi:hypothetical protein
MPGTQNPKTPQTPELVKIEELPAIEFRTWRLYSDVREPLPLYVRYMGGTWWAIAPVRELPGAVLDGAQAQAIIVTAESAAAAADALWRVLEKLGVRVPHPVFAGPA